MRLATTSLLFAPFVLAVSACAGPAGNDTSGSGEAITGVTDFFALEAELGLVKDVEEASGWSRPDAKLKAGSCYKSTVGGAHGARYEVRRYTTGAAFFTKLGAGALSGDERPVACVDLDGDDPKSGSTTLALSLTGLSLDLAMRFHLGRVTGGGAGAGHTYNYFERATVEIGDPSHYCGIWAPLEPKSPGGEAYAQAITTCKQHSGDADTCDVQAMTACEKATTKDIVADTIDRPAFPFIAGSPESDFYFYNLELDSRNGQYTYLDARLVSIVYRYGRRVGTQDNAFTLAGDPVGKYVGYDQQSSDDKTTVSEHARFEKLDAHHVVQNGIDRLAITPKGSDAHIVESAVVLCTRAVDSTNNPTVDYQCSGI
jgi:hypothetical protein